MEEGRYVLKMLHTKKKKTKPKNTAIFRASLPLIKKPLETKREAQKSSGDLS